LRSIQKNLATLDQAGIRPVAISVDTPAESRALCHKAGYTFTFLSDSKLQAIRQYDLVHKNGGEEGQDIARPAEFLLDSSGLVRWRMLTENYWVRARPQQVLDAAKSLP
jgi:peroxiredoxin